MLLSTATLISPLTETIYLPLIPLLSTHFSVSIQSINLTITIYIVFQAIAPVLLSTHPDTFGRRPIYLATFTLYTAVSLGLALNHSSYAGLLVLRALQSLGSSAVLSICYGTVADLSPSSSRGKMLGPVMASSNLGTAIGPVVGGAIAYGSGTIWWAFWALVIFGAGMLAALAVLMPETARNVVGNGSTSDHVWNWPLIDVVSSHLREKSIATTEQQLRPQKTPTHRLHFKSPLHAFRLIFYRDTALILWIVGSTYALWYAIQASIPLIFQGAPYHFNELQTGLAYLPGAAGVVLCMYITGKTMDHNYRIIVARWQSCHPQQQVSPAPTSDPKSATTPTAPPPPLSHPNDLSTTPLELARSRFCIPLSFLTFATTVAYGWSTHTHTHVAVPLAMQFLLGFLATWLLNIFNALLVDGFPEAPSTAATAGNLIRCGLSAAAVAALQPGTSAVGRGWFFTIIGGLSGAVGLVAIAALRRWGMRWRVERSGRERAGQA